MKKVGLLALLIAGSASAEVNLGYSTYISGTTYDGVNAVATDAQGNMYVAGWSNSHNTFPEKPGNMPDWYNGRSFLAKFDSNGQFVDVGYVDNSYAHINSLAVDSEGNAYLTGRTHHVDANYDPNVSQLNCFILKLNPSFEVAYAVTLGGDGADHCQSIAVDNEGNAYVTGQAGDETFPFDYQLFPLEAPGAQGIGNFVAKYSSEGDLVYSTYLGRLPSSAVAVDEAQNVYLAGRNEYNAYGTSDGAFEGGPLEEGVFVLKLNTQGSGAIYSAFFGGARSVNSLNVDGEGNAYFSGSAVAGFPITEGAFQHGNPDNGGGYVAKLNAQGTGLVYSAFIGGSETNFTFNPASTLDGQGRVHLLGSRTDIPVENTLNSDGSVVFLTLNAEGTALVHSARFGSPHDSPHGIAVRGNAVYIVGTTLSEDFPVTENAYQPVNQSAHNWEGIYESGFLTRFDLAEVSSVTPPRRGVRNIHSVRERAQQLRDRLRLRR